MFLIWCYQRFSVLVTAYYMVQQTSKTLVMGFSISKVFLVKLQHMEGKALHILEIVCHLFTVYSIEHSGNRELNELGLPVQQFKYTKC